MSPLVDRRAREHAAIRSVGHGVLAAAARALHLDPDDRAEAERLISLPYGAEGFALRRFVAARRQAVAA